jgi:hypothetical protein
MGLDRSAFATLKRREPCAGQSSAGGMRLSRISRLGLSLAGVAIGLGPVSAWAGQADLPGVEAMQHQQGAAPRFPGLPPGDKEGESRTEIEGVLEAVYDTNVARSDAETATKRGLRQADEILTPHVEFDLLRPFGRQSLFLTGGAGYDLHAHNTKLNRERIDVEGGLEPRVGPCQGVLSGRYIRGQSDLKEIVGPIAKNVETTKSANFNADCLQTIGFSPTVGVSNTWVDNSASSRVVSDYRSFSANTGLSYTQPSLGVISLYGQYDKTEYPNRPILLPGTLVASSFTSYAAGFVLDRHLGRVEGTIKVSYTSLRPSLKSVPGFHGLTYSAALTATISSKLSATLDADRSTKPSIQVTSSFLREDSVKGDLIYALNSRMTLNLGGLWSDRRYGGAISLPGTSLTSENMVDVHGGGKLDLSHRLALVLDVRHEIRHANLPSLNYASTRVGLSAVVRY